MTTREEHVVAFLRMFCGYIVQTDDMESLFTWALRDSDGQVIGIGGYYSLRTYARDNEIQLMTVH